VTEEVKFSKGNVGL